MGKRVAILQSSYIPWKGYFDIIRSVDEFILFDEVQFTRRDWRNRNRIKTAGGLRWLTIPVKMRGRYHQSIAETEIESAAWPREHWEALRHSYARASCFRAYRDEIESLYRTAPTTMLSAVNEHFLLGLCALLGISTPLTRSVDYGAAVRDEGATARLVSLCEQAGATEYLSGPAAQSYLDEARFDAAGIGVTYMEYGGYPEYEQVHPPFEHGVSAIDLLFHTGAGALDFFERGGGRALSGAETR